MGLVVKRSVDEELVIAIGDEVIATVMVVEVGGSAWARLKTEAGKHVAIHRKEVWERICAEKAAKGKP